jgi:hypothetical protein
MVTCDTAINNLKKEIIKKITNKKMMKKLDKKKIPFSITEKDLRENIKKITKKDFLFALKHFKKIRKKSKKSGRSRKGGHWMSWFVYILCRLSEDDTLYDYVMSTCDEDFEELEQAAAEYYNSVSDAAVSPLADAVSHPAAVSPLAAAAVPDVTYTVESISSMTEAQREEIPHYVVDSWGYDDGRYEAYNGLPGTGLGGGRKKPHRRRKRKTRKRKSQKGGWERGDTVMVEWPNDEGGHDWWHGTVLSHNKKKIKVKWIADVEPKTETFIANDYNIQYSNMAFPSTGQGGRRSKRKSRRRKRKTKKRKRKIKKKKSRKRK